MALEGLKEKWEKFSQRFVKGDRVDLYITGRIGVEEYQRTSDKAWKPWFRRLKKTPSQT